MGICEGDLSPPLIDEPMLEVGCKGLTFVLMPDILLALV